MSVKIYELSHCSTCKKAAAWLVERNIEAEFIPIKETAPSKKDLKRAYEKYGSWSKVFNTSGKEYRARKLPEKLPGMSSADVLSLLSENGMLVKRPFLVTDDGIACGFKYEEWRAILEK